MNIIQEEISENASSKSTINVLQAKEQPKPQLSKTFAQLIYTARRFLIWRKDGLNFLKLLITGFYTYKLCLLFDQTFEITQISVESTMYYNFDGKFTIVIENLFRQKNGNQNLILVNISHFKLKSANIYILETQKCLLFAPKDGTFLYQEQIRNRGLYSKLISKLPVETQPWHMN